MPRHVSRSLVIWSGVLLVLLGDDRPELLGLFETPIHAGELRRPLLLRLIEAERSVRFFLG